MFNAPSFGPRSRYRDGARPDGTVETRPVSVRSAAIDSRFTRVAPFVRHDRRNLYFNYGNKRADTFAPLRYIVPPEYLSLSNKTPYTDRSRVQAIISRTRLSSPSGSVRGPLFFVPSVGERARTSSAAARPPRALTSTIPSCPIREFNHLFRQDFSNAFTVSKTHNSLLK